MLISILDEDDLSYIVLNFLNTYVEVTITIIMVIFKCYLSREHIADEKHLIDW